MSDKLRRITINPKMFISPPFIKCPRCGKEAFGVLGIGVGYTRRCRECWHTEGFSLPKLSRKVIYLDQYVLSNMMKAINPKVKVRSGTDLSFYKQLFVKLDRLMKLQLIICPSSSTHRNESLTSINYDEIKRITEHFSLNISFFPNSTIQRFQVSSDFRQWLGVETRPVDVNTITHGRLDEWQDKFIISVDMFKGDTDFVEKLKNEREQVEQSLLPVFKRWQTETNKKFDDWLNEEQAVIGSTFWNAAIERANKFQQNPQNLSIDDILPSEREMILLDILDVLKNKGYNQQDRIKKANEYLLTRVKEVPYFKLSTNIYASMAREAALGRKKPFNRGTFNDIDFISTLAPYCDAMLIDKEFQTRLSTEPLKSRLGLANKVYSLNKRKEFMDYLDDIEAKMTKKHLALVNEVYGDWYNEPYTSMFDRN